LDSSELTILIEPVCTEQLPGYFLKTVDQASQVHSEIDHPRLKIMFDCYHVHRESGSLLAYFRKHAGKIGHVQIASAEGRAEPFPGELDYGVLLSEFQRAGYTGLFGCEYRPRGTTEEGLSWRATLSSLARGDGE
jgi:hydroxypyruvate isomerase